MRHEGSQHLPDWMFLMTWVTTIGTTMTPATMTLARTMMTIHCTRDELDRSGGPASLDFS